MRLLDTGLRIFGVSYIMGFRIVCRGVIWYMPRQCVRLPPREVVVMIRYSPGFDDKILPVCMRGWSVTTGTAHTCVVYMRCL